LNAGTIARWLAVAPPESAKLPAVAVAMKLSPSWLMLKFAGPTMSMVANDPVIAPAVRKSYCWPLR
jgi:hypothetical protein